MKNQPDAQGSHSQGSEAAAPLIRNISDTARWVAFYRALETERPDAHFRDHLARRLAGERGEQIVRGMEKSAAFSWAIVVRTCVMDEMILRTIERDKLDTVVNLAAGLDARPYRLPLPPTLRWIEVDLPGIVDYKEQTLAGERAVCEHEVVKLDLSEVEARRELFARVGASSERALVISEGLLVYLAPEQVGALAADLHAQASFRWWLADIVRPEIIKRMAKTWGKRVAEANAPFRFAPEEGTDFFRRFGWREAEFRSLMEEARRLKREMPLAWLGRLIARVQPHAKREKFRRMGGCALLERA
ncbi:MAG TPA: SAM-dependent methyltransferase [Pyrinomonadaceae bacterium]|jgi:methyltransferase (TIGR00027 family)|nr:SAM-dependent methyltransferase [Pyrinomonadaceae bacterium]